MTNGTIKLYGRIFLSGEINVLTGLHIGDTKETLTIGGVDMPVIRNKRDGQPYIPGSSLKGKLRSLSEKLLQAPLNFNVNRGKGPDQKGRVDIHIAEDEAQYVEYWVNPIFGVVGDAGNWVPAPNRLVVRDIPLEMKSAQELLGKQTDLPYTEIKWEATIDRVTSAATPRQIERVPAGAVFGPMEMVFNVYLEGDIELFVHLLTAMELLEDDYLGGHGSRGSGKIEFHNLSIRVRAGEAYTSHEDARFTSTLPGEGEEQIEAKDITLPNLINTKEYLLVWLKDTLLPPEDTVDTGETDETE